jgi:hypothetical protein
MDRSTVTRAQSFIRSAPLPCATRNSFLRSRTWNDLGIGRRTRRLQLIGEAVSGDDGRSYRAQICALVQKR